MPNPWYWRRLLMSNRVHQIAKRRTNELSVTEGQVAAFALGAPDCRQKSGLRCY